jgi:hypothetical protein
MLIGRKVRAIPVVEWPRSMRVSTFLDHGFAEVADISQDELRELLEKHFAPLLENGQEIGESVPLFGGLILEVDSARVIYPQCCGDLSDVLTWLEPIDSRFGRKFVAPGGHPVPEIIREGAMTRLVCFDPDDPFEPPVDFDVVFPTVALDAAVVVALDQLSDLANRLDRLDVIAEYPGLARVLAGVEDWTSG